MRLAKRSPAARYTTSSNEEFRKAGLQFRAPGGLGQYSRSPTARPAVDAAAILPQAVAQLSPHCRDNLFPRKEAIVRLPLNRIFRTFGADRSRSLLLSTICTI